MSVIRELDLGSLAGAPVAPGSNTPGERVVQHAVSVIVTLLGLLAVAALLVVALVTINVTVTATGQVEPIIVWTVRPREEGTISSVHVATGDVVEAGRALFTLDSTSLQADLRGLDVQTREARLDGARVLALRPLDLQVAAEREALAGVSVVRARAHFLSALVDYAKTSNVDSALRAPSTGHEVALDLARADVLNAESELRLAHLEHAKLAADSLGSPKANVAIERATNQAAALRERLNRLEVRAPGRGIVLTDHTTSLVGRSVREGEPVLEIGSADGWRAQLFVSEREVHQIRPGQRVRLEFVAAERTVSAVVAGIVLGVAAEPWHPEGASSAAAPTKGSAPQYGVIVSVLPEDRGDVAPFLRRGATVGATITVGRERIVRVLVDRLLRRS